MRRGRALAVSATLVLSAAATAAAHAASGTTTATFTVISGALAITVPPSTVNLGSGVPGSTITAQFGIVQITDARGLLAASWTGSVASTSFVTGGGTVPETIPAAAVSYWSGQATTTTGSGTFTPGQANAAAAVSLASTHTAFTLTAGAGGNSAAWNPTFVVSLPAAAVAGTYTGTVTHSVA